METWGKAAVAARVSEAEKKRLLLSLSLAELKPRSRER